MDERLIKIAHRLEKAYSYNEACKAMDFISNFSKEFLVSPTESEINTARKVLFALETTPLGAEDLQCSLPYKTALALVNRFQTRLVLNNNPKNG